MGARRVVTADALRRAFDERFAAPLAPMPTGVERLLIVAQGGARFALRLAEIGGIHEVARIVRVPGGAAHLVGLAGVAGRVVPVFDLAAILGAREPPAASLAEPSAPARPSAADDASAPRPAWIVVVAAEQAGLLVAEIALFRLVAPADVHAVPEGEAAPRHVQGLTNVDGVVVPIVSVPSVIRELAEGRRAGASTTTEAAR